MMLLGIVVMLGKEQKGKSFVRARQPVPLAD